MATLREFEEALKSNNMVSALAVLDELRKRDKARRAAVAPARRIAGRKMTPDLARAVLDLHKTTPMTQQEIAFKLGVNQGRVNEVIKHGKWLTENPAAPEAIARNKALKRIQASRPREAKPRASAGIRVVHNKKATRPAQLLLGDF